MKTLLAALRAVRPLRLLVLVLGSIAFGLASDWLRHERVVFSPPMPNFTTVPSGRPAPPHAP